MRVTTILHPKADRCKDKAHKNLRCFNNFHLHDYIAVPYMDLFGEYNLLDCMSNFSRTLLYIAYKQAQGLEVNTAADMFYAGQRGVHTGLREGHRG